MGVDRNRRTRQKGPLSERSAAWLAHQSGGLGVGSSNLPAPTIHPLLDYLQHERTGQSRLGFAHVEPLLQTGASPR